MAAVRAGESDLLVCLGINYTATTGQLSLQNQRTAGESADSQGPKTRVSTDGGTDAMSKRNGGEQREAGAVLIELRKATAIVLAELEGIKETGNCC